MKINNIRNVLLTGSQYWSGMARLTPQRPTTLVFIAQPMAFGSWLPTLLLALWPAALAQGEV